MTTNNTNSIQPVQNPSVLNASVVAKDPSRDGKKQPRPKKMNRRAAAADPFEHELDPGQESQSLSQNDSGRHRIDYCA